jgi:hypothetical protein
MIRRLLELFTGQPMQGARSVRGRWPAVSLRRRYRPETFSGKTSPPAWILDAARKSTRYDGPGRKISGARR